MRRSWIPAIAVLLVACGALYSDQPHVTATYEPVPQGFWVEFVVHNSLPDQLWALDIHTADAQAPVSPEGWRVYQDFRQVSWRASAQGILPGHSLGGFSYMAGNAPGSLAWWIGSAYEGHSGSVTPVLIPEPSSLLALLAGVAGVTAGLRRAKR